MSENSSSLSSPTQMERPRTPPPRSLTNLQIHGVPDRSSSTPAGDPMSSMNQDLLNSYVKNALRPRSIRDPAAYAFILNQLQGNGRPNVVSGWLRALSLNSSELTIENSRELLSIIFKLDFTTDKEVQKAFMSLMIELCTSHSTYINQMLKSLIFHITPKKISAKNNGGNLMSSSLLSLDDSNSAADKDADDGGFSTCLYDREKCEYVRSGIMKTIKEIAKLVPMSSMSILQIFTSLYPYKMLDSFVHKNWLLSALDICRDVPSIREQILSTVTSRLLQMDVDFRVEYEESGLLYESIVHRSSSDAISNDVSPLSTSPAPNAETQPFCSALSNKLDILMDTLLDFVTEVFKTKNHSSNKNTNSIGMNGLSSLYEDDFNIFLNNFIRYVLPTYNSKVVQFVIFKICSFNEKYTQAYLDSLMNIIKDERSDLMGSSASTSPDCSSSTASRVSACSYVASFLTRANFIKDYGLVENYLIDLLSYAKDHSAVLVERSKRQHEKSLGLARSSLNSRDCGAGCYRLTSSSGSFRNTTPDGFRNTFVYIDTASHQVFYAAVQAAMHIFSYCYPQLVERGLKSGFTKTSWLNSIGFQAVLSSPLCPLDNCNQGIVKTFKSVWDFVAGDSTALKTAYSLSTSKYPYISLTAPKGSRSRSPLRSASTSSFAMSLSKSSSPTSLLSSSTSSFGQHGAVNSDDFGPYGTVLFPFEAYLLDRSAKHITPICKIYDSNFFNFEAIAEMKKEKDKDKECELKMVMPQRSTVAKRVKMEEYVKEENDENIFSIPAKKVKKEVKIDLEEEVDEIGKTKIKIEIDDVEEEDDNDEKKNVKKKERIEIDLDDEEDEDEEDGEDDDKSEESEEDDDGDDDDKGQKSLSTTTSAGFNYPVSISPNFNFSFD